MSILIVNGFLTDIVKEHDAIWLGPQKSNADDAGENVRYRFCTTADSVKMRLHHLAPYQSTICIGMQAPPDLTCDRCKQGPREMRGFPMDPTSPGFVQPKASSRQRPPPKGSSAWLAAAPARASPITAVQTRQRYLIVLILHWVPALSDPRGISFDCISSPTVILYRFPATGVLTVLYAYFTLTLRVIDAYCTLSLLHEGVS